MSESILMKNVFCGPGVSEEDKRVVASSLATRFVFGNDENALVLCRANDDIPSMCLNSDGVTIKKCHSECKVKRILLLFLYKPIPLSIIDHWKKMIYAHNEFADLRIDILRIGLFSQEYLEGRIARHCVGWRIPQPQKVKSFPEFEVGSLIKIDKEGKEGKDKSDPAFLSVMFGKTGALLQRLYLVAKEFERVKKEKLAEALGLAGSSDIDAVDGALLEMRETVDRLLKYEGPSMERGGQLQRVDLMSKVFKRIKEIKAGKSQQVDAALSKMHEAIGKCFLDYATRSDSKEILESRKDLKVNLTAFPKILLCGESGVGKTLLANYIQNIISLKRKISRISIPEFLNKEDFFEYAMFGYVKGAYTGARDSGRHGLLMESIGNVIFLDEIGEASPTIQAKLLAYMDDYRVRPRGWEGEPFYCPVLIIAATNRDLKAMAEEGRFRKDLLARFTDIEHIPPLRERLESIDLIIDILMQRDDINPRRDNHDLDTKNGRWIDVIEPEALLKLRYKDYREGNFRELEEVLRRACRVTHRDGRTRMRAHDIQPL